MRHRKIDARGGFSALELTIAVMLLALLAGSLSLALQRMRGMTGSSSARATLQDSAERALKKISTDLSRSGQLTLLGDKFPYLFDEGAATGAFAAHAHAPATHHAAAGDPDFGPNREVVFVAPRESDPEGTYGDDVPDIDASGRLIWDAAQFSYVVVTGADGANRLERRTNAASPVTIASNVERVVFDDNASSGFVIPVDSVRVRLFFRKVDAQGVLHRHQAEQIIKLRNGV
ncbi:MAG TPA: hypothetical protein VM509_14205 [Planctomycetota bacterium]|nr:hypothetical protein [Planctomycetota bacterium]